jgi:hypothetical protein
LIAGILGPMMRGYSMPNSWAPAMPRSPSHRPSLSGAARPSVTGGLLSILLLGAAGVAAQELNPRAYAPMPTGGNIVMLSYGRSSGGVLFDPSLPVEEVQATIHSGVLLYGRSFGLFGRSANAGIALPYAWGEMDGLLAGEYQRISRSGLGDLRGQLTVNVLGGPALTPREFASHRPTTILGLSLAVAAPSGQYDPAKLINIGSNRWSFKPEVGFSKTKGRWYLELYGGVWVFGTNTDFFGGSVREQDPIGAFQAHVSYTFRPRLWLAGDATFYTGGRTTVDGEARADLQRNSRLGVTLALPVGRRSAFKVAWATGITTRTGADFDLLGVAFQTVWFGRP